MKKKNNHRFVWQEDRTLKYVSLTILCSLILTLILFTPINSRYQAAAQDDPDQVIEGAVATKGIWISRAEIMRLPTSGAAWSNMLSAANGSAGTPDLSDQDDSTNVIVLAKALVFVRTNDSQYRSDVVNALRVITNNNTENGGRTLALGRELAAYVIAADLIDLASFDPSLDSSFRAKLRELLTKTLSGDTLQETHENRPNNWGTHAGASRAAVAAYLGDQAELDRTATVFEGWLGNRSAYAGFSYGDLSWQCDSSNPVGVNPAGCTKSGHSIDGALPDDMRRGGSFKFPPSSTGYPWEALQGAIVEAEILHRAGYPAWDWEDKALLRAVEFLYSIGWQPDGDDRWQVWLINYAYGTNFSASAGVSPGKNIGWTDWSHSDAPVAVSLLSVDGGLDPVPVIITIVVSLGLTATALLLFFSIKRKRQRS